MKSAVSPMVLKLLLPVLILLSPVTVFGDALPSPEGKIILTVSGNIGNTNSGDKAEFDLAMLEALGVSELKLETPWTEGLQIFNGVLASKVLNAVAAQGKMVVARAINDYQVKIPVSELRQYPILLALKQNGSYMRVRDKGPIWVIYPIMSYPELDNGKTNDKWIWQLSGIHML